MMADTRVAFDDADAYDRYMGRWSRAIGEKFLAWLDPPENRSWLDVGCGSGAFTGLILRHAAPGTITGIDPSPQQVEHAKRTVAAPQADFRAGTADDLPFETGAFDVVVSALVIHFVEDRPKAFREMLRVTRPGGIVAGYTWRRSPTIIDAPYGSLARAVLQLTGVPVAAVPTTTGFSRVTTFGIDTNYLDVYGLRVVAGRPFDALDATASNKPVVVDRSFARRFLNDQFAVGRRIRYAGTPDGQPSLGTRSSAWPRTCSGIRSTPTRSARRSSIQSPRSSASGIGVSVRLRGSAASGMDEGFAQRVHQIVASVDRGWRMTEIRARATADGQDALVIRLVALALSLVLLTVLLFSAAGVYSLMSFTVAQRKREIGIRAALGASSASLLRSVFSRVAVQVAIGVALGIIGAGAIAPASAGAAMAGQLALVTPAIALTMVVVGVLAA